jgi:tetratricopeptide (TPR) repeat protein
MTNYEAAARDYREAVRWNPNNALYWSVCGDFHQRTTNYDAAVTDFTHCITLQPTNADFYADRARVVESTAREFTRQGARETAKVALDRALDDWDQAAALNPEYVNDLGEFEGRKGQNESAIADFTECIQARPSEVRGWALRAAAYEREARYLARHGELAEGNAALAKAFADWNQSVNLATNLLSLRGDFHARNQEFALALADFQQAAELQPPDEYSLISLAWFLATCPDKSFRNGHAALDAAKKACEMDGYQSGFYLAGLAAAYAEMGNFDQAVHFQKGALANKWYSDVLLPDMQHRLTLYEKGKPCHKILAEEE